MSSSSPRTVKTLYIAAIDLPDQQQRQNYNPDTLQELADSIRSVGLINPITVRAQGDRYLLIAGSRRLRAHQLLRRSTILARIIDANGSEDNAVQAHENLFRDDISPVEEGHFLRRLLQDEHYTLKQLALLLNKSEHYVNARLQLITLDDYLRDAVDQRTLPISHALELAQFDNSDVRRQYTEYAIATGASLMTLRYWRQQYESTKSVPTTTDQLPIPSPNPAQIPGYGWYCYACNNYHPAQEMQTLHLCQLCFLDLQAAKLDKSS